MIVAAALPGIPEVRPGDDLAILLADAAQRLADGDVLVIAHKVVSKAEGRVVALAGVQPGERAIALGAEHGKDARLVEVILGESEAIVRSRPGVLICRTRHGYVCANAGVDASNAGAEGEVVLLPADPDASARALRARLHELTGVAPAIVIADSFGRAWRIGQCDVAIGVAGLRPSQDWRGHTDGGGRVLESTVVAVADEAAAAADLVRGKDSREPAVLVRGLERHVIAGDGPGAAALIRARDEDLFQ
ncbi:MAG: coenzyme F420-0:L-glutamate ligase / coenzyme F420:gamma-L-glutamate ligase [Solirubrobacteraceae bacterium]|nr:coenzyme F420-0:L-glutamate ligase / coenzyme F420:gamma-L-glutamate ligase [Solirubrobacteraceae bacterium]